MKHKTKIAALLFVVISHCAFAQDNADEVALKLANPVANMVSFPLQNNFDYGFGTDDEGFRWTMNVQPVIPVGVGKVNFINRIILPIIKQNNVIDDGKQSGVGDAVVSCFLSPRDAGKVIWGVGPVLLVPTASDPVLGTQQFGIGPTILIMSQFKGISLGLLANHFNSVAGKDYRANVNQSYFQPFFSYTKKGYSPGISAEMSQDWEGDNFTGALLFNVSKVTKLGASQPISLGGSIKYFFAKPDGGPDWGFRLVLTFIFPKKG